MSNGEAIHDCWNTIGVRGDGSCDELRQWVHCHNCPVFGDAATRLFDHPLTDEDLSAATRSVSTPNAEKARGERSVIVFRMGSEWFALPTTRFQEIAESRPVHTVPHRRGGVMRGLINVRGELLPCVSLERLLGAAEPAAADGGRVVVMNDPRGRFAFIADQVADVCNFSPEELRPAPATIRSNYTTGLLNWNGISVGCLDDDLIAYTVRKGLS